MKYKIRQCLICSWNLGRFSSQMVECPKSKKWFLNCQKNVEIQWSKLYQCFARPKSIFKIGRPRSASSGLLGLKNYFVWRGVEWKIAMGAHHHRIHDGIPFFFFLLWKFSLSGRALTDGRTDIGTKLNCWFNSKIDAICSIQHAFWKTACLPIEVVQLLLSHFL